MKELEEKKQWVLCPWCGSKTRLQIFRETELKVPFVLPKVQTRKHHQRKEFHD